MTSKKIINITGPPPTGTTIISEYVCYDNSINRIRITQNLSNGQTKITYKTPMKGGPYVVSSIIV